MLITASLLCSAFSHAEQKKVFDNYEVHYATMLTSDLESEVARVYDIPRSGKRAFAMINVRRLAENGASSSVPARIEGTVTNLLGQSRVLKWQEVKEQDAIYSLSHFPITNREKTRFKLLIFPGDSQDKLELEFGQEFYTD